MADFDLTQTDQQVQNILNDGQSAMGAGAQTTLTTEYVMLKDTNGVYHKILKSSFTEAIRDVLAGLLVNNDKGTTISQIAAIASGDFGSVTPANLASVLGAVKRGGTLTRSKDLNDIKETGAWTVADSSGVPNSPYDYGILLCFFTDGNYPYVQIIFGTAAGQLMFRRGFSDGTWSDWLLG